ncbi:unnamed protein product [Microthlaspi erraticum]|uniref:Uncharacterized protein n=1 Tax=Microthlaspi erraticum TaxID=1685480 RepID=A0A6D2J1G8_9BRAS|nr:unnamed protein product [Microthlaspi erraticum]
MLLGDLTEAQPPLRDATQSDEFPTVLPLRRFVHRVPLKPVFRLVATEAGRRLVFSLIVPCFLDESSLLLHSVCSLSRSPMAPLLLLRLRENSPPLDPQDPVKKEWSLGSLLLLPSNASVNPPDPPDPPDPPEPPYSQINCQVLLQLLGSSSDLEPPDSQISRPCPCHRYLLQPSNPPLLFHPLPPSSIVVSITTGLVIGYGTLSDNKLKRSHFIDSPGFPSLALYQKINLPSGSSPPSNPIHVMDPSLRFGHCSNTTPSFNDIFSTVLFCFEPCSPTTTLSLANVQPPSAEVGFRHSFSMSIVKSTGSCAGISYLGLGGLSTYWRLSTPTSAVVDNCQPFDSKRSLAFISLDGASRAICPIPLLLTA